MKLVSLLIFHVQESGSTNEAYLLSRHVDLTHFNYFMRTTINEHILFHSRLICSRTPVNQRQSIEFEQNLGTCHVFRHVCGIAGAVLSDPDYPSRVAFVLLNRALSAFVALYSPDLWKPYDQDKEFKFSEGDAFLNKFQNPKEADELSRIQDDLKEVQEIIVLTMDKILERGEKLDVLMSRTTDLSAASERFYRQAKQQNQCCKWY